MSRVYVNNFATSLSVATTTSALSLTITSATGLPTLTGSDYYHLTLGGGGITEIVKVTARTSTTLTVIRAQENTSAIAWAAGTPVRMNFTAASISGKQDQIAGSSDVIDFGSATSLEIPNSAAPTVNATGEIALDTTITDHKGMIKYYTGSNEMVVIACPTANLTTTDNYALTYDAATDAFDFSAMGGAYSPGANVDTFIQTPSSANLRAALTDETGTGPAVFATSPTITTPLLVGRTDGGNAAAGNIGEVIDSEILVGSAVSLTSTTAANVTSISLTAGTWLVWGNVGFSPQGTTNATSYVATIHTTSATLPTIPGKGAYQQLALPYSTGIAQVLQAGQLILKISGTTTVYLIARSVFSAGTNAAYGYIGALRVQA